MNGPRGAIGDERSDARRALHESRAHLAAAVVTLDQAAATLIETGPVHWLTVARRYRWWIAGGVATAVFAMVRGPRSSSNARGSWLCAAGVALSRWATVASIVARLLPSRDPSPPPAAPETPSRPTSQRRKP